MIGNLSAQYRHHHPAQMGYNRLYRKVRAFPSETNTIHRRCIDHDRRHPIAAPEQGNAGMQESECRSDIRQSEEIKRGKQHKHGKQDACPMPSDAAHDKAPDKRKDEPERGPYHATHHPDLFHRVSQVDQVRLQHRQRTDQAGIVKEKETDLFPYILLGKEVKDICFLRPFMRIFRCNLQSAVEQ